MGSFKEIGNDSWQKIALILVSILLTGLTSWMAFGKQTVTREQVIDMIQTGSPYVYDRKILLENIEITSKALDKIAILLISHDKELARNDERLKSLEKITK